MNLDAHLAQLETAQLIRPLAEGKSEFIFNHALVQDAAYGSLLKQERKRLHSTIAGTIAKMYADRLDEQAATIAQHYSAAEEWRPTADYSLRAGDQSLRVYALRETMSHFERALIAFEKIPDASPEKIIDAILGWAQAALRYRPFPEQLEQLGRAEKLARELNDKARLARALYWIGRVHLTQGHSLRSLPPMAECFTLASELGDERLTILPTFSMGLAMADVKPREALQLFERAIELAQKYSDVDNQAVAWSTKAMTHARLGEFTQARDAVSRALDLVPQMNSPMSQSDVYVFLGWTFLDLGEFDKGIEFGQRCVETARAAENMDCMCGGYDCVGFNRLMTRHLAQAKQAFEEAIRRSQFSGADLFENMGRGGLAIAEYFGGKTEALADLEKAYADSQSVQNPFGGAVVAETLGEIYLRRNDPRSAKTYLQRALEYFESTGMRKHADHVSGLMAQLENPR